MRSYGRNDGEMRPFTLHPNFTENADGSVLVCVGNTKVICTASLEDKVPPFLRNKGTGWVTAEYGMLPGSTHTRSSREAAKGKQSGRTVEIQRLIGRSLRACLDFGILGEHTITVDCDVIQADGGTRTASITGGFVALALAVYRHRSRFERSPLTGGVAALSAGIVDGRVVLDLDYEEDSSAEVDFNVVMTHGGSLVEVQGTAEGKPFSSDNLLSIVKLCGDALPKIRDAQYKALANCDLPQEWLS